MKKGIFVDHTDYDGANAKVLRALRKDYEFTVFNHLNRVFADFNEDVPSMIQRFDFMITNLPRSQNAEMQMKKIREDGCAQLNSKQYQFFMRERMYQPALYALKGIRIRRPEMTIVLYSGAPRFILEGALNDGVADFALPRPNYLGELDREIDFLKQCIEGKFAPGRMT